MNRRSLMAALPVLGMGAAAPSRAEVDAAADAEVLALVDRHRCELAAVLASDNLEDDCPLWLAYLRTTEALIEAKPRTIGGVICKAHAALREAQLPGEGQDEGPNGFPAVLGWSIVQDLVRLNGGAA